MSNNTPTGDFPPAGPRCLIPNHNGVPDCRVGDLEVLRGVANGLIREAFEYVWLGIGESESGDSYYTVFAKEPTEEQLDKWALSLDAPEEGEGPGRAGSYVYVTVEKVKVQH